MKTSKGLTLATAGILLMVLIAAGCKPKPTSAESAASQDPNQRSHGYFHTPFQSESQFIVITVVSDLAEQIYYAANHRLPDPKDFTVTAAEEKGSPIDAPIYHLKITLDPQHTGLKADLNVNDCIWSPAVYRDVAALLAKSVGLAPNPAVESGSAGLVAKLLPQDPEIIERENEAASEALEKDFTNPTLHERAALLLGAFAWREHSGQFFEIRSPLSRITAHLTMADLFGGGKPAGLSGSLAEAIMLTLVNDQAPALAKLKSLDASDPAVAAMIRALQTRNTGDYRIVASIPNRSVMESVAWFAAFADYASANSAAWNQLDDSEKQTIDFVRVLNEEGYSVEAGHQLLALSLPLELKEEQNIYQLACGKELKPAKLVDALNVPPERCFVADGAPVPHVRIIGWGQWAMFLQRHLCHAVQQNFHFMNVQWGVPDDARDFAARCETQFRGLRLYPFVRRFNCMDVESYHRSVDDGFQVTVATPHLVPAQCWNYLCYNVPFAARYSPNPNPHINEWHSHNPPPGTVYDLHPRLDHPSLIERTDTTAKFQHLHELAPCDARIISFLINKTYRGRPTPDQVSVLYHDLLPYSITALLAVADSVYDQPEQYEKFMLQAAAINPAFNYDLGNYALAHNQEEKAALFTDKACDSDPDAVRVTEHAEWRVRYYLKKGDADKARAIADQAGEVYSYAGLSAKAQFFEATSNYDGAFEWYSKIEERYEQPGSVMAFCQRYQKLTGDTRFDSALQTRIKKIFPQGIEKVALSNFQAPPTDGMVLAGNSGILRNAGLQNGDIVVAVGGVRTHNVAQYSFARDSQETSELDLIVWHEREYREVNANPPNRRFGVSLKDYHSN